MEKKTVIILLVIFSIISVVIGIILFLNGHWIWGMIFMLIGGILSIYPSYMLYIFFFRKILGTSKNSEPIPNNMNNDNNNYNNN